MVVVGVGGGDVIRKLKSSAEQQQQQLSVADRHPELFYNCLLKCRAQAVCGTATAAALFRLILFSKETQIDVPPRIDFRLGYGERAQRFANGLLFFWWS